MFESGRVSEIIAEKFPVPAPTSTIRGFSGRSAEDRKDDNASSSSL